MPELTEDELAQIQSNSALIKVISEAGRADLVANGHFDARKLFAALNDARGESDPQNKGFRDKFCKGLTKEVDFDEYSLKADAAAQSLSKYMQLEKDYRKEEGFIDRLKSFHQESFGFYPPPVMTPISASSPKYNVLGERGEPFDRRETPDPDYSVLQRPTESSSRSDPLLEPVLPSDAPVEYVANLQPGPAVKYEQPAPAQEEESGSQVYSAVVVNLASLDYLVKSQPGDPRMGAPVSRRVGGEEYVASDDPTVRELKTPRQRREPVGQGRMRDAADELYSPGSEESVAHDEFGRDREIRDWAQAERAAVLAEVLDEKRENRDRNLTEQYHKERIGLLEQLKNAIVSYKGDPSKNPDRIKELLGGIDKSSAKIAEAKRLEHPSVVEAYPELERDQYLEEIQLDVPRTVDAAEYIQAEMIARAVKIRALEAQLEKENLNVSRYKRDPSSRPDPRVINQLKSDIQGHRDQMALGHQALVKAEMSLTQDVKLGVIGAKKELKAFKKSQKIFKNDLKAEKVIFSTYQNISSQIKRRDKAHQSLKDAIAAYQRKPSEGNANFCAHCAYQLAAKNAAVASLISRTTKAERKKHAEREENSHLDQVHTRACLSASLQQAHLNLSKVQLKGWFGSVNETKSKKAAKRFKDAKVDSVDSFYQSLSPEKERFLVNLHKSMMRGPSSKKTKKLLETDPFGTRSDGFQSEMDPIRNTAIQMARRRAGVRVKGLDNPAYEQVPVSTLSTMVTNPAYAPGLSADLPYDFPINEPEGMPTHRPGHDAADVNSLVTPLYVYDSAPKPQDKARFQLYGLAPQLVVRDVQNETWVDESQITRHADGRIVVIDEDGNPHELRKPEGYVSLGSAPDTGRRDEISSRSASVGSTVYGESVLSADFYDRPGYLDVAPAHLRENGMSFVVGNPAYDSRGRPTPEEDNPSDSVTPIAGHHATPIDSQDEAVRKPDPANGRKVTARLTARVRPSTSDMSTAPAKGYLSIGPAIKRTISRPQPAVSNLTGRLPGEEFSTDPRTGPQHLTLQSGSLSGTPSPRPDPTPDATPEDRRDAPSATVNGAKPGTFSNQGLLRLMVLDPAPRYFKHKEKPVDKDGEQKELSVQMVASDAVNKKNSKAQGDFLVRGNTEGTGFSVRPASIGMMGKHSSRICVDKAVTIGLIGAFDGKGKEDETDLVFSASGDARGYLEESIGKHMRSKRFKRERDLCLNARRQIVTQDKSGNQQFYNFETESFQSEPFGFDAYEATKKGKKEYKHIKNALAKGKYDKPRTNEKIRIFGESAARTNAWMKLEDRLDAIEKRKNQFENLMREDKIAIRAVSQEGEALGATTFQFNGRFRFDPNKPMTDEANLAVWAEGFERVAERGGLKKEIGKTAHNEKVQLMRSDDGTPISGPTGGHVMGRSEKGKWNTTYAEAKLTKDAAGKDWMTLTDVKRQNVREKTGKKTWLGVSKEEIVGVTFRPKKTSTPRDRKRIAQEGLMTMFETTMPGTDLEIAHMSPAMKKDTMRAMNEMYERYPHQFEGRNIRLGDQWVVSKPDGKGLTLSSTPPQLTQGVDFELKASRPENADGDNPALSDDGTAPTPPDGSRRKPLDGTPTPASGKGKGGGKPGTAEDEPSGGSRRATVRKK